jgi:hypothetical protein
MAKISESPAWIAKTRAGTMRIPHACIQKRMLTSDTIDTTNPVHHAVRRSPSSRHSRELGRMSPNKLHREMIAR